MKSCKTWRVQDTFTSIRSLQLFIFFVATRKSYWRLQKIFSGMGLFTVFPQYLYVKLFENSNARYLKVELNYSAGRYSIWIWYSNIHTPLQKHFILRTYHSKINETLTDTRELTIPFNIKLCIWYKESGCIEDTLGNSTPSIRMLNIKSFD